MAEPEVKFEFTVRNSESGEAQLRQVAVGLQPIILIEPEETEDGDFVFHVDSTDLDFGGMKWLFATLAEILEPHVEDEDEG